MKKITDRITTTIRYIKPHMRKLALPIAVTAIVAI